MSKGRPTSSSAWNTFAYSDDPKQATCLLCEHIIKADAKGSISTSGMSAHLDSHRTSSAFRQLVIPGSRNDVESRARSSSSPAAPAQKKQATQQLTLPVQASVSPAIITATILDIILLGMLPFMFAANAALQRLLNLFQPSYNVPNRTTFARKALERHAAVLAEEKALFTVHGTRGSSLQFDHWTESVNSRSYITVCASRLDGEELLPVSRSIGTALTDGKDAPGIAADVRAHCAALGIDCTRKGALFAATTDTTAVMPASVRELGLLWKPCDAHVLNLVLKHAFTAESAPASVWPVQALFARVRTLINTIRGSGNLLQQFEHHVNAQRDAIAAAVKKFEPNRTGKKRQLPRMLKTYPETRFNYVYLSIRRVLVFWEPLQQFLLQPDVAAAIPPANRLTVDDLPLLQDINTILSEFQGVMVTLQASHSPTISSSFISLLLLHIFLQQPLTHRVGGLLEEGRDTKALRECLRDELHRRVLADDSHYRKQQSPSMLVTPGPTTAGVPFASATLRTAFDLGAVAAALDPHLAGSDGWRALFNQHYAAYFPPLQENANQHLADKRGEQHIRRLLKNLCWFEHQLLQEHAAAAAAAPPAAPVAAPPAAAEDDDAMQEDVLEQSAGALAESLKSKLNRLTRKLPAAPAAAAASPAVKQPAARAAWLEEVDRFFGSFVIPQQFINDNAPRDPLVMWAQLRGEFPLLSRVAQRIFSVAATSAEAERVFSTAGLVATDSRASLKPETLCALVFLVRVLRAREADVVRRAERAGSAPQ